MFCPAGIQETLIFDTWAVEGEVIYRDAMILRKSRREELRRENIKVAHAGDLP
ncbi:MAG: hypothetical protein LBL73_01130 [Synergistaceae bacterium]|jgi:hypothetical protein|nr:hypothetical protein [Synergistaceae bacterium]